MKNYNSDSNGTQKEWLQSRTEAIKSEVSKKYGINITSSWHEEKYGEQYFEYDNFEEIAELGEELLVDLKLEQSGLKRFDPEEDADNINEGFFNMFLCADSKYDDIPENCNRLKDIADFGVLIAGIYLKFRTHAQLELIKQCGGEIFSIDDIERKAKELRTMAESIKKNKREELEARLAA